MRRFRFTLETVLRVSRHREEALQKEHGLLVGEREAARHRLAALFAERQSLADYQKQARLERNTVASEAWYQARQGGLGSAILAEQQEIARLDQACEAKRLQLVEASKKKRVFEKLEERQKKDYLVDVAREEQAFLDELARYRHEVLSL